MERRSRGLFAGRRIGRPGPWVTVVAIAAAFALGIGAGWLTGLVPDLYARWNASPEPSVSPSPSASATPEVSVGPVEPITRELDDADTLAGLTTLAVPDRGDGTLSIVSGATPETEGGGPVRYVRVEFEGGLGVASAALATFVMDTLNDPRGWGSQGRQQFVRTDGAADVRIVLASPYTAATLCRPTDVAPTAEPSSVPSATPSADLPCETQGIVPLSLYDWAAGLSRFGEERTSSRQYQLAHGAGYVLGEESATCESGRASVMVVQQTMSDQCTVNPWPFPDAPVPATSATPAA